MCAFHFSLSLHHIEHHNIVQHRRETYKTCVYILTLTTLFQLTLNSPSHPQMDLRVPSPRPAINIMPSGTIVSISPAAPPLSETKIEVVKKSGIPGTGPGTCMVCLEDCDDILGSAWLHQPRRVSQPDAAEEEDKHKKNLHDCAVAACVACLKTYFTVRREATPIVLNESVRDFCGRVGRQVTVSIATG